MKKILLLSVTSFVLAFGQAMATDQNPKASNTEQSHMMGKHHMMAVNKVTGKVRSWNGSQLSVTTASAKDETFVLAPNAKRPDSLKDGSQVTVWYREANGEKTASRISLVPSPSKAQGPKAGVTHKRSALHHPSQKPGS